MDSQDILKALGASSDSPKVTAVLAALGVKQKPKMPADDIDARIDLKKLGLCLIFKPELKNGAKLAFVAVQFVSDKEAGYKSFRGALPGALAFTDSAAEAKKKLGKPTESKKQMNLDRWKPAKQVLTVDYSYANGQISVLTVHVPQYY